MIEKYITFRFTMEKIGLIFGSLYFITIILWWLISKRKEKKKNRTKGKIRK